MQEEAARKVAAADPRAAETAAVVAVAAGRRISAAER
jgi:hypothetical protein